MEIIVYQLFDVRMIVMKKNKNEVVLVIAMSITLLSLIIIGLTFMIIGTQ